MCVFYNKDPCPYICSRNGASKSVASMICMAQNRMASKNVITIQLGQLSVVAFVCGIGRCDVSIIGTTVGSAHL